MRDATGIATRLGGLLAERVDPCGGRVLVVRAPARSEIAGNHTDHEGGRVIAAALDSGIDCLAQPRDDGEIRVFSQGFEPVRLTLDDLGPRQDEFGGSAGIVRGMVAQMAATGRTPRGFDIVMTSDIPAGGGLSSSAAFELALCRAMEALWPGGPVDAVTAARMAQYVERGWFGKPCGLMDQLAVSIGGLAYLDFEQEEPHVERLVLDLAELGFALVLTDVGCDHSAYTAEYAAVPCEMRAVATSFGHARLCGLREEELLARVGALRSELGDRPVLRALHYFREMELVDARWDALKERDADRFLALTRRSGASSAMFLQNVSAAGSKSQDAMVALALSECLLGERGATRIHGGGFGGSIQAFVPLEQVGDYVERMGHWFGDDACRAYALSSEGAWAQWL